MEVNKINAPTCSDVDPVHGPIDHCELWLRAAARVGAPQNRVAMALGMSPQAFSQAFSTHYDDRNPPLKRMALGRAGRAVDDEQLLQSITREYAGLLADALGLEVGRNHEYIELCRKFAEAGLALLRHGR